ncbi:late competence development ComFB family protein [Thiomicrorhabdus cannonii]|uniref:late competence development ComFB family protein n=1 Tax=Thiomicrorhabdus cannonii TaxID=2748011 RepID=UPI0015BD35D1|nr:late competence development ComFB family protein [Thiomicrorhabdus cannonii]
MEFDSVHNYYDRLVFNEIAENYTERDLNNEQLADMACIALNHLPPRYIRYDIDMSFYMSGQERLETEERVRRAVHSAYLKIKKLDHLTEEGL